MNKKRMPVVITATLAIIFLVIATYQSLTLFNKKPKEIEDINPIAIFIDGKPQPGMTNFPTNMLFSHVECFVNGEKDKDITGEWIDNKLTLKGIKNKTDCNVYFESLDLLREKIIANNGGLPRPTSGTGLLQAADGMMGGTSYYFRGTHDLNNNVIFAGHQWKIIRIDGAGNIRLLYNGVCPNNTCTINGSSAGANATIGTSFFGTSNVYATSIVKGVVDNFYNGLSQTDRNKTVQTRFCVQLVDSLVWPIVASYNCTDTLTLGAGLWSLAELVYAQAPGGAWYLNGIGGSWQAVWLAERSPTSGNSRNWVYWVNDGTIRGDAQGMLDPLYVRPVIALSPGVLTGASGNGSATNPYIIN